MDPHELLNWHQSQLANERRLAVKFELRQAQFTSGYYWNTNRGHAERHRRNEAFHMKAVICLNKLIGQTK